MVLRADQGLVRQYLDEKNERSSSKLANKYEENFDDIVHACRTLYRNGMDEGASRCDIIGLVISVMLSIGCRKGAITDPTVPFMTWKQYQTKLRQKRSK